MSTDVEGMEAIDRKTMTSYIMRNIGDLTTKERAVVMRYLYQRMYIMSEANDGCRIRIDTIRPPDITWIYAYVWSRRMMELNI
jgi:hypothetical protein